MWPWRWEQWGQGGSWLFSPGRMTVPGGAEERRRSVPFQLLLLLEKMQDSRQKAVQPKELAYCLQKYNIPCKTVLLLWLLACCSEGKGSSRRGEGEGPEKRRVEERRGLMALECAGRKPSLCWVPMCGSEIP